MAGVLSCKIYRIVNGSNIYIKTSKIKMPIMGAYRDQQISILNNPVYNFNDVKLALDWDFNATYFGLNVPWLSNTGLPDNIFYLDDMLDGNSYYFDIENNNGVSIGFRLLFQKTESVGNIHVQYTCVYVRNGIDITYTSGIACNYIEDPMSGYERWKISELYCFPFYQYKDGNFYDFSSFENGGIDDALRYIYAGGVYTSTIKNITTWITGVEFPVEDGDNPYWNGGTSEEGGGDGNFSDDSDDVDVDNLPTIDSVGTGFATLFTPNKGQLKDLADVMWDNGVFQSLQNLVENISNMFTSLSIVPFEVEAGSTVEVNFLGLFSTGIYLTLASKQYYEFNMGSINLANDSRIFTSGSALDYSPFSKLGIFLPFIGFQELDIDECRNATIGLKYRIDILSGTCVALISVGGNTIYQFTGNCLSQIPITNENMQSLVTDAVNVGIAAAATHSASGAASADMAAADSGEKSLAKEAKYAHAESHLVSSQGRLASATANAAMGMKPTFGKAGAISASASLLAVKQPYLFLTTPRQSIPEHYQRYCGFPSNISGKLNTFSGFTVVEDIRLNGLVATSPEVAEIYQLLKNGVII